MYQQSFRPRPGISTVMSRGSLKRKSRTQMSPLSWTLLCTFTSCSLKGPGACAKPEGPATNNSANKLVNPTIHFCDMILLLCQAGPAFHARNPVHPPCVDAQGELFQPVTIAGDRCSGQSEEKA